MKFNPENPTHVKILQKCLEDEELFKEFKGEIKEEDITTFKTAVETAICLNQENIALANEKEQIVANAYRKKIEELFELKLKIESSATKILQTFQQELKKIKSKTDTLKKIEKEIPQNIALEKEPKQEETKNSTKTNVDKLTLIKKIFQDSQKKHFNPFRTKEAQTFYRAYSDPETNVLAKETLENIVACFNQKNWEIKTLGGKSVTFILPNSSINITKTLPKHAGKIIELYEKARTYNGWTWEEALRETEDILARNYQSPDINLGRRSKSTQIAYNDVFHSIQEKFHAHRYPELKKEDQRKIPENKKYKISNINWGNITVINKQEETARDNLIELQEKEGVLLKLTSKEPIPIDARQYLAYQYFRISQEIPHTQSQRQKSHLYTTIMLRIADLIGFTTGTMNEQIKNTEKFMHEELSLFKARAQMYQDKNPNLLKAPKQPIEAPKQLSEEQKPSPDLTNPNPSLK